MTFRKAHENGNHSAYDRVDSLDEVADAYRRCRKDQSFILSDIGVTKERPTCDKCGELITLKRGNRGHYYPSRKVWVLFHYDCAWGAIFDTLETILRRRSA